MRNVWTIARRELRQYFISPVAYAAAIFLFAVLGILFYVSVSFGLQTGQIPPDGRIVMGPMVTLLLLTTPLLTMGLIAGELGSGTMELVLTAPIRDWELVVGKWAGALGFFALLLGITWIYPILLHRITTPGIDQGLLVVAYLGLLLMMSAIVAIGVAVSSFFRSPLAAGFITLAVILGLWVIGGLAGSAGGANEVIRYLSFGDHFYDNLYRGVLDLSDVLYYLSTTIFALFVASQAVELRRWR